MADGADLARSLGVNNASCKLLVDHLSSRGVWRGVNRTSIIVGAAVLASVTVEDPISYPFTGLKSERIRPSMSDMLRLWDSATI